MEINFNPIGVPQPEASQPIARQDSTVAATNTDSTSFQATSDLQSQLNKQPAVRPDQVANAQALVSNPNYPPSDVLDRIAVLLATNLH